MRKFVIAGCGGAGMAVAHSIVSDGRGEISGLFDPIDGMLEKARAEYPTAVAGDTYEKVLAEASPDAVIVAGPDHLHAEQGALAIQNGYHVLIEKPLATTVEDASMLVGEAEKSGVHVMTDHTMRYVYPFGEMARAARDGKIGEIFFLQGNYIHDMWSYYTEGEQYYTPWRIDEKNPQNILFGGGCHPIDLMLWAVDSPAVEVFCYSNKICIPQFPSDDCYLLSIVFENGAIGKVFVTSGCSGHGVGDHLEIYGTQGTLSQGNFIHRESEKPTPLPNSSEGNVEAGHGWGGSVTAFLDLLEGKIENPISASDGAKTVAVCEAALNSIRTGKPVTPDNI